VLRDLESIDPRVELVDVRPNGNEAEVDFLVHPNKAPLLGRALAALEPVVATEVRDG
jgi:hypothetical protein